MQSEKVIFHIVDWLKNYAENAGVKGFVLGISGGLDSAVVSTLCAKTGLHLLCLQMPILQASIEVSRAQEHIDFLTSNFTNVHQETVDLTEPFVSLKKSMSPSENDVLQALALANTRARLRMTALYYYAQTHHLLVAGTGNKIEDFGVGFFTKYGDGGVDLSPIGDLMKSEVFHLAKTLGIPQSIVNAVPTDGLFGDNRTDEDQLGASYDELEWAMKKVAEGHKASDFKDRKKQVFEIYERLHRINKHKIDPIPVCEIPEDWKGNPSLNQN